MNRWKLWQIDLSIWFKPNRKWAFQHGSDVSNDQKDYWLFIGPVHINIWYVLDNKNMA